MPLTWPRAVLVIGGDEQVELALLSLGLVPIRTTGTGAVWWGEPVSFGEIDPLQREEGVQLEIGGTHEG